MKKFGQCPVCDAQLKISSHIEETEIISCNDCQTKLVVKKINSKKIIFEQAPEIEEDWGE